MSSNEWKSYKLGEIATFYNGRAYKNEEFKSFGTPIVRIQNLTGEGKTVYSDLELDANKYIENGDLIYAWSATFGPYIWKGSKSIYHYHIWKIECNEQLLDKQYFYYKLKVISDSLQDRGNGTLFVHITKAFIESFEISIPPIETQRHVACILSALDEKIELNRQTNATLEAIAQSIFRGWFLDNEDVANWDVVPLPEIINLNLTRSLKKGSIAPYLDMANMPTQGHRAIEWRDRPFGSGTKFVNGDTLLARITPCLENGKTAFVDFLEDGQVGWGSTEYIVFSPKPPLPPEYGYYLARTEEVRNHAIQNMIGTSGRQRASASCFDSFMVSVPPVELATRFGNVARSLMAEIKANDEESRTLASIRDALLPKLMNGEFDLEE
jgi:type I restriction enzyme S subunit